MTVTKSAHPGTAGDRPRQRLSSTATGSLANATTSPPRPLASRPHWLPGALPWMRVAGGGHRMSQRLSLATGDERVGFVGTASLIPLGILADGDHFGAKIINSPESIREYPAESGRTGNCEKPRNRTRRSIPGSSVIATAFPQARTGSCPPVATARNLATATGPVLHASQGSPPRLGHQLSVVDTSECDAVRHRAGGGVARHAIRAEIAPVCARLCEIPLFGECDDPELPATIAACLIPDAFRPGEVIVSAGQPADTMFLIARGKLARIGRGRGGKSTNVAILADGDYFGEDAIIDPESSWEYTVKAVTAGTVLALPRAGLARLAVLSRPLADRIGGPEPAGVPGDHSGLGPAAALAHTYPSPTRLGRAPVGKADAEAVATRSGVVAGTASTLSAPARFSRVVLAPDVSGALSDGELPQTTRHSRPGQSS